MNRHDSQTEQEHLHPSAMPDALVSLLFSNILSDKLHTRLLRDERLPLWHQVEAITAWRDDEAKSIAYRMEWEGKTLEEAIRAEVIEGIAQFGIHASDIAEIVLQERWGVLCCSDIILSHPRSQTERQHITDYLDRHAPIPPEPITLSGTGKAVTESFALPDEVSRIIATHSGRSNFMVFAQPVNGGYNELLVNRIGVYHGSTLLRSKKEFYFEITADGTWTITIEAVPITHKPLTTISGTGDMVSERFRPATVASVPYRFVHTGRSNFSVTLHSLHKTTLLQNVIGPLHQYTQVTFPHGLCWWEVKTEGSWRIDPGEED